MPSPAAYSPSSLYKWFARIRTYLHCHCPVALPRPHTRPALFTNGSLEYAHTLIARYHAISIHASTRALFPNIFSSPEDDSRGTKRWKRFARRRYMYNLSFSCMSTQSPLPILACMHEFTRSGKSLSTTGTTHAAAVGCGVEPSVACAAAPPKGTNSRLGKKAPRRGEPTKTNRGAEAPRRRSRGTVHVLIKVRRSN